MGNPNSKQEMKEYCLRNLGKPVIDINVADEQVEDAIFDAYQYYRDYHSDGSERTFIAHELTQQEIDQKYIQLNDQVQSVLRVFNIGGTRYLSDTDIFNVDYQLRLHDIWDMSGTKMTDYFISRQNLAMIDDMLNEELNIRFNQKKDKLEIDFNWDKEVQEGYYLLIEAYKFLNEEEIYSDWAFRDLATAFVKLRWGNNLSKFNDVQLAGGVTLNGQELKQEAQEEIRDIKENFLLQHGEPMGIFYG